MKKTIALILTLCTLLLSAAPALAVNDPDAGKLYFNADGSFRVLAISDFQDIDVCSPKSADFLERILDYTQPDLVVLCGDQLSDSFTLATPLRIKTALSNILEPINSRQIPFLFTFGNHDHDNNNILSSARQAEIYKSFGYCFAESDGCDPGTYNKLVWSSDGSSPTLNIYMMDTNNTSKEAGGKWDGVHPEQVAWYKAKSDGLRQLNGGSAVPSVLFQHIPVKEIYQLLTVVPEGTPGAYTKPTAGLDSYYVLDPGRMTSAVWQMGEAPGSEILTRTTGQYEAWLEKGDIIGAFFGHDHVNVFVGQTDDGISLGYVGGFGFAAYGSGDERSATLLTFSEADVENYTVENLRYCDLPGYEPGVPDDASGAAKLFGVISNGFSAMLRYIIETLLLPFRLFGLK